MIGVHLQLFDNLAQQASLTDIQAVWWNNNELGAVGVPDGKTSIAATDENGYINLDLSAVSALRVGDYGFLCLYKKDLIDHEDSLVFSGKVMVSEITFGVDMYYVGGYWKRPTYWPTLPPNVDGVEKVSGLLMIQPDIDNSIANSVAFQCTGAYTVDWGDGTATENVTNVIARHVYIYNNIPGDKNIGGYKTVIVTITAQVDSMITHLNITPMATGAAMYTPSLWLDLHINLPNMTSVVITTATSAYIASKQVPRMLEHVALGENKIASMISTFTTMVNLQMLEITHSELLTTFNNTCLNCTSLKEVSYINTAKVTNSASAFQGCSALMKIPLFDFSLNLAMTSTFNGCKSLKAIPILIFPVTGSVVTTNMFTDCSSLEHVPQINFSRVVTATSMFTGCTSVKTMGVLNLGALVSAGAFTMFGIGYSLSSIKVEAYNAVGGLMLNYCNLGVQALTDLLISLPTVSAKSITISSNPGYALVDKTIATLKGWTVY